MKSLAVTLSPPNISIYAAWIPMTRPTAMTIFQWLSLSLAGDPSFEKKSEPDQKNTVIIDKINQLFIAFSFSSFHVELWTVLSVLSQLQSGRFDQPSPLSVRSLRASIENMVINVPANIAASPIFITILEKGFFFIII